MIEVREPNYTVDLPGDWEVSEGEQPSSWVYHELNGPAQLTVMLLGVKPLYEIADQQRLLADYAQHRSNFEMTPNGTFQASELQVAPLGDAFVASWAGYDADIDRRTVHYAVLVEGLLGDFLYEARGLSPEEFHERAQAVFDTVGVKK